MIWLFLILWAVLFGLAVFAVAVTPTTVNKTGMLGGPFLWTGGIAGVVTLVVAGFLSLIGVR